MLKKKYEFCSHSAQETQDIAHNIAQLFICQQNESVSDAVSGKVFAFYGDLGAGKTTFIKAMAQQLGIVPHSVTSPTFQYVSLYQGRLPLYHFDLYRLRGADDFLHLGFDELLQQNSICCIEWAERIPQLLPKETVHICITHLGGSSRGIHIEAHQ